MSNLPPVLPPNPEWVPQPQPLRDLPIHVRLAIHIASWMTIFGTVFATLAAGLLVIAYLRGASATPTEQVAVAAPHCSKVPNGEAKGWHRKCHVYQIPENTGHPVPPVVVRTY